MSMSDIIIATNGNVVSKSKNVSIKQTIGSKPDVNWYEMKKELNDFINSNPLYHESMAMRQIVDDALCAVETKDIGKLENIFKKAGSFALEVFTKISGSALGAFAASLLKM